MTQPRTGRPPHYTESEVLKGIDLVEQGGGTPSGESVKKMLCDELGVPPGINAQSLQKEVDRLLEERSRARRERLVAALPAETLAAAKEIGTCIQAAVLAHLGEEHHRLRTAATTRIVEITADLDIERRQVRDLWQRIEAKDRLIAELESDRQAVEIRLDDARAETATLQTRLAEFEHADDLRTQMFRLLKDALAQQPSAAA